MLSLQEISDRMEIQQLITVYANAIDRRDFDALDRVFTPDAYIDYRALGGIDGRFPAIKVWLGQVLPTFPRYTHLVGNIEVEVSGDTARARTACINPMEVTLPGGGTQVMLLGLWYVDQFVRTRDGWRMSERVEEPGFQHNVPEHIRTSAPS
jgi:ketosteroid isomerase-like protein